MLRHSRACVVQPLPKAYADEDEGFDNDYGDAVDETEQPNTSPYEGMWWAAQSDACFPAEQVDANPGPPKMNTVQSSKRYALFARLLISIPGKKAALTDAIPPDDDDEDEEAPIARYIPPDVEIGCVCVSKTSRLAHHPSLYQLGPGHQTAEASSFGFAKRLSQC